MEVSDHLQNLNYFGLLSFFYPLPRLGPSLTYGFYNRFKTKFWLSIYKQKLGSHRVLIVCQREVTSQSFTKDLYFILL